jgi:putative acetyltransferase
LISAIVRTENHDDYEAIRALTLLAFETEGAQIVALVELLRATEGYLPELSLVAEIETAVVGHIMFTSVRIETVSDPVQALTIAPLSVHPTWQNQGIGSYLVRQGLEMCQKLGHSIVTVVGHPIYYPRFGFVNASSLGISMTQGMREEAKMIKALAPGALNNLTGSTVVFPSVFNIDS